MQLSNATRCLVVCALFTAGLAAHPAVAAPSVMQEESVVVHFADLNLSQPQDARRLYRRIRRAAGQACGDIPQGVLQISNYDQCVRKAVAHAVADVNATQVTKIYMASTRRT